MVKKDFIIDDGKVRECSSNIAKMNVFEWVYYRRSLIRWSIMSVLKQFLDGITLVITAVTNSVSIIFLLPITVFISAWLDIRKCRKEMDSRGNRSVKAVE